MSTGLIDAIDNPVLRKCAQARVRMRHALSWGTVVVTVSAFIFLMTYFTTIERAEMTRPEAARAVMIPLIVIQAIILMGLGTGAVAAGIAIERDSGRIDYHRMTPMSPTAKIFGFLFGLPARQYFLFAMTMPFLLTAVFMGGFPLSKLALFYLVFFTSVWTYHMTGMTAGMLAKKPWQAALISLGSVVVLYFILPNLSQLGVTFFEFLTIRPTLLGMVHQEIEQMRPGMEVAASQLVTSLDSFRPVPFYAWELHPIAYTLLVQGALIAVMFTMVHRKWRRQDNHALTKVQGIAAYFGVLVFLGGSLWPIVTRQEVFNEVWPSFDSRSSSGPDLLFVLLMIATIICGLACVVLLIVTTPSRHTMAAGVRRMRKLGLPRMRLNTDEASSLPTVLIASALTLAGGMLILQVAASSGLVISGLPPLMVTLAPLVLFCAVALFVQGVCERFSQRVTAVLLFLLWAPPLFAGAILAGAFDLVTEGLYVMLPCPPASLSIALTNFFEQADLGAGSFTAGEEHSDPAAMTMTATLGYSLAAVGIQVERLRWTRRVKLAA